MEKYSIFFILNSDIFFYICTIYIMIFCAMLFNLVFIKVTYHWVFWYNLKNSRKSNRQMQWMNCELNFSLCILTQQRCSMWEVVWEIFRWHFWLPIKTYVMYLSGRKKFDIQKEQQLLDRIFQSSEMKDTFHSWEYKINSTEYSSNLMFTTKFISHSNVTFFNWESLKIKYV